MHPGCSWSAHEGWARLGNRCPDPPQTAQALVSELARIALLSYKMPPRTDAVR